MVALRRSKSEVFTHDPQVDFIIGDPEHWRRSVGTMLASSPNTSRVITSSWSLSWLGCRTRTRARGIEYFASEVLPLLRDLDPRDYVD